MSGEEDWREGRPSFLRDRDSDNSLVWKIAAGVAIGIITAVLAIYWIERLRVQAAIDEAKERAWAKFYKRPVSCDNNPSPDHMVECANQHIRARRQFEETFAAGRL